MSAKKSRFALFIGNRGFFPASLLSSARREMTKVLTNLGHEVITLDSRTTRHGAVETPSEGQKYANFLRENHGKFDGVILTLPNFGDETGAVAALKDAGVPILVHAYPDDLNKMAPELRRDAFCGKFSVMDVFYQTETPFTALKPHTVSPKSDKFAQNIDHFDRICRVVAGMKNMVVGAVGARTTAFKTVRCDELTLQRHGITTETFDLSDIFARMKSVKMSHKKYKDKITTLRKIASWKGVPAESLKTLTRLGVVLDGLAEECSLDAMALRCWDEMQWQLHISPCVLLSEMNDRHFPVACEVDLGNAVTMRALGLASGEVTTCLDWNNNYGDDEDRCILFHCGPVPSSMMTCKGQITDHAILKNAVGEGCAYGCNTGRIAPTDFSYGSMMTEDGLLKFYLGEGRFTDDPIPADFFGCAGVAEITDLQDVLQTIGYLGHRHHVSVTSTNITEAVAEAFDDYLGYDVVMF